MGAIDIKTQPNAADIVAAQKRLLGVAVRTPLINAPVLDDLLGARVFLKAEILQRTGSFKFRGAYNRISSIAPEKRAAGVVAYSSGNHAQGVAAAAKLLGMPATIVMPSDAPKAKLARTRALGAEVVTYDRNSEDRAAIAEKIVKRTRRDLGAALRRSVHHRRPGHHRRRNRRGPRAARIETGHRGDRRVGRRACRRHFARRQGARAGSDDSTRSSRKISTIRGARSCRATASTMSA